MKNEDLLLSVVKCCRFYLSHPKCPYSEFRLKRDNYIVERCVGMSEAERIMLLKEAGKCSDLCGR